MYGETVDGIDGHRFESELSSLKRERGVEQDVELTEDDLVELVARFKAIYEDATGRTFPQDAREQLARAVEAVFKSWDTPRAQVYRRAHEIPDDLGTAVNVVQMVFGNKGETSATGVAFTRDPSTGEPGMFGEFLVNAQGEDVVAGIRTPQPLAQMEDVLPEAFAQFVDTRAAARGALPRHAGRRVHGRGGHASTCCRRARRSAPRRPRCRRRVDMVDEGLISREEAVARIDPAQLDQLLHPMLDPETRGRGRGEGPERVARRGRGRDRLRRRHRRGARARRRAA